MRTSKGFVGRRSWWGLALALTLGLFSAVPTSGQRVPIAIRSLEDLRFGAMVMEPPGTGSVVIDPCKGERWVTGGVCPLGGEFGPAIFEISGEPYVRFIITLPEQFQIGPGRGVKDLAAQPGLIGTLGLDGKAMVRVGATLILQSNVGPGRKVSPFTISVDYL